MRKVIRESENEVVVMNFEDFEADLRFQIGQCSLILEDYEDYIRDNNDDNLTKEQYDNMRFDWFIQSMNDGCSIEIMGDCYYYQNQE